MPVRDVDRVLAALLSGPSLEISGEMGENGQILDSLALVWLNQRLQHIVTGLRQEAIELAKEAASHLPTHSAVLNLAAWLEMYERGAVARALPYFITRKKPVGAFMTRNQWNTVNVTGVPEGDKNLSISDHVLFQKGILRKKDYGSCQVLCHLQDISTPQPILQLVAVPRSTYEHLIAELPKLSGADLSHIGGSLSERLPNTRIIIADRLVTLINESIKTLRFQFIQSLILSGTPPSIEMHAPWRSELRDKLAYTIPASAEEVDFPKTVKDIRDGLLAEVASSAVGA